LLEDSHQLVFSTAPVEVALNVHRRVRDACVDVDGRLSINGKFFPRRDIQVNGFNVQLLQGTSAIADTTTDHLGAFTFEAVTPGRYSVHLHTGQLGIMIRPVKLGVLTAQGASGL